MDGALELVRAPPLRLRRASARGERDRAAAAASSTPSTQPGALAQRRRRSTATSARSRLRQRAPGARAPTSTLRRPLRPTDHLELRLNSEPALAGRGPAAAGRAGGCSPPRSSALRATYTFTSRVLPARSSASTWTRGAIPSLYIVEPVAPTDALLQRLGPLRLQAQLADGAVRRLRRQPGPFGGGDARAAGPPVLPEAVLRVPALRAASGALVSSPASGPPSASKPVCAPRAARLSACSSRSRIAVVHVAADRRPGVRRPAVAPG